jgi:two-component system sensor histidine kinase PhoQ
MEVMGNVLDNACKYCLEFVEVSVRQTNDNHLHILVEDDGPGIPQTSGLPCSIAGSAPIRCVPARAWDSPSPGRSSSNTMAILTGESLLGGACMEVVFGRQLPDDTES